MTEAAFPLLGSAFVMLVVLPAFALLARGALWALDQKEAGGPLRRPNVRYLVLVGSSALPLAWFFSAGLHQAEEGSVVACLFHHKAAALCFEPGLFAGTLALLLIGLSLRTVRGVARAHRSDSTRARDLVRRVERIIDGRAPLCDLAKRIVVTEDPGFALGTQGVFRPRVVLGRSYAEGLHDDALASALGHEAEHVRALDPLRYLVLSIALAANPFGRWLLEPHARRWFAVREAHCDREAVIRGAAPLSLAEAIVQAARPTRREAVGLGARDTSMLKFRIGLLFAFAEKRPTDCCRRGPLAIPTAVALLLIALLLPHHAGTEALDAVHAGAEHAFTYFWR
jgi:hypothetical protein